MIIKKLLTCFLAVSLFLPYSASAAIAFDFASSTSATTTNGTILAGTHTVSGTNTFLNVCVTAYSTSADQDIVSGVTYAGTAMTRLLRYRSTLSDNYSIYHYYLYAPTTGTNNVIVTFSSAWQFGAGYFSSASYSGVAQSAFPDSSKTTAVTGHPAVSTTTVTVADNSWAAMCAAADDGPAPTAGSGTTRRTFTTKGAAGAQAGVLSWWDLNAATTPAGTATLNMTPGTSAGEAVFSVFSMAPAGAAGSGVVQGTPSQVIFYDL